MPAMYFEMAEQKKSVWREGGKRVKERKERKRMNKLSYFVL